MGRAVLGKGVGLRGVYEVPAAHERAARGAKPDSQPALHALVVANHQPRQRVHRLPGAAGPHGHLHARQDPHAQDQSHPDLPRASLAEGARERGHGPVSGVRKSLLNYYFLLLGFFEVGVFMSCFCWVFAVLRCFIDFLRFCCILSIFKTFRAIFILVGNNTFKSII